MERVFKAENGNVVIAQNAIQAEAFANAGLVEVKEETNKKK